MIIDMEGANNLNRAYRKIVKINTSESAKSSDMTAHIFRIDPNVVLDNGDHPIVGSTLNDYGSWVVSEPTGDFEKSYKDDDDLSLLFHLIQSEDKSKTEAPFFDFTPEVFSAVEDTYQAVNEMKDTNIIGVVHFNDGINGNPLFIVRYSFFEQKANVEVFNIVF